MTGVLFLLPCLLSADEPADLAQQHFHTGLAYERLARLDEAYTELQLAANLDTENPEMALALGLIASRLGRLDQAQRALEHSIALDANSVASYYQLALIYEKKELNDRALESWHRFLALNQDSELKAEGEKHIRYLEGLH